MCPQAGGLTLGHAQAGGPGHPAGPQLGGCALLPLPGSLLLAMLGPSWFRADGKPWVGDCSASACLDSPISRHLWPWAQVLDGQAASELICSPCSDSLHLLVGFR